MAEVIKTWTFDANADGWTVVTANGTGAYVASGGVTTGYLNVDLTGRNKTDDGHWIITTTFEALGVPAGRNVTGYGLCSYYGRCLVYNTVDYAHHGDLANTEGALFINDGTTRTLIPSQPSYTSTTAWAQTSNNPNITGLSLPSNTSIEIHANHDMDLGNNAAAQAQIGWDDIAITIYYSELGQTFNDAISVTYNGALQELSSLSVLANLNLSKISDIFITKIKIANAELTLEELNQIEYIKSLITFSDMSINQLFDKLNNSNISVNVLLQLNESILIEYTRSISAYSTLEIQQAINSIKNAGFTITVELVLTYLARMNK